MSFPAKVRVSVLVKLGIAALALGAVAVLLLRGVDVRGLVSTASGLLDTVVEWIRAAGPWVFFGAMAVLPAFGFPMTPFYLVAGSVFATELTLPGVIGAAWAALAVQFALAFWLAHRALRPVVEWLLARTPFRIPQVTPENELSIAVLVRVTPGPPLPLQNFILALAGVRFRLYMVVSMAVQMTIVAGVAVFGKALVEGRGKLALFGVCLLVAAFVLVHLLRKRFAKRNASQA